ncbi:MAG: hypothetical protein Q9173_001213 [Seirophora scorigena]
MIEMERKLPLRPRTPPLHSAPLPPTSNAHQFLSAIGRKCSVVNLDPANERTSYPCALDIRSLVTLEDIMADEALGPNGGVLYALEELQHNVEWLQRGLDGLGG